MIPFLSSQRIAQQGSVHNTMAMKRCSLPNKAIRYHISSTIRCVSKSPVYITMTSSISKFIALKLRIQHDTETHTNTNMHDATA